MDFLNQDITSTLNENAPAAQQRIARILVVADALILKDSILAGLMEQHQCRRVTTLVEAREVLQSFPFDLLVIQPQLTDGDGLELVREVDQASPSTKTIVLSNDGSANAAVHAMRCGAVDFVHAPSGLKELGERVAVAIARSQADRKREDRLVRLKKVCKQLNIARHEISEQIDLLCHDLVAAYKDMSNQLSDAAMASEFRTLLRQELDVEDLLRTALEYALTKTGPTNAAVFLPDGSARYALGAYVNYDCPRDSIDSVLERLGNAVCPQLAGHEQIVAFKDSTSFANWIGLDAGMLGESEVFAFSCEHEGECLAVIVLFRSRKTPFESDLVSIIETLRPIFAEQLAQVIKVHHRAQPQWPDEADDDCDELDYNDDAGFGYGGLAA